jgi:hypothetical protein
MNTMNMPGFTAGISLYKTRGRYRASVFAAQQRTVVPQLDEITFFDPFGFSFSDTTTPISIIVECIRQCESAKKAWLERCHYGDSAVESVKCVIRAEAFENACIDRCYRL